MARPESINPDILAWAREAAGLSVEEAADRLGLTTTERASAADKLSDLESGQKAPTRPQLLRMSQVYRRPLLTFYMKEPPVRGERGEDFRTVSSLSPSQENANLDALLRDIRARQEMVKSLLEDEDEARPLTFVGSLAMSEGVGAVVDSIAQTLRFDRTGARRAGRTAAEDLFRELRIKAEAAGVFVLLVGDLGSHHSAISESVFRGFAIADHVAPFVVINDQDATTARSFTLIHELAHIWLGRTGVSGTADQIEPVTPQGQLEQFCNDVAGEFLLPSSALAERPQALDVGTPDSARQVIARIADAWGVSEPMVAYRLSRLGWISRQVYRDLATDYAARWRVVRASRKEKAREAEGGPSYYVVRQFKLGNALIDVVRRTLRDNLLTHTKAAKVLGVKPSSVEPLLRSMERSRGALFPDARG